MNISIIIPTYNVQDYIAKCLESIATQTYTDGVECLVIDDCGTDNSIAVAEQFIADYSGPIPFQIIHHEQNKGVSAARNTGIRQAKGKYLYFIDPDDWMTNDCLEKMMNMATKYPTADLIQGNTFCNSKWARLEGKKLPAFSDDKKWIKKKFLTLNYLPTTCWNKLIKREFVVENELFFKEGFLHEDEMWQWGLSKTVRAIAFLLDKTYHYTILRPSGIMDTMTKKKDHFLFFVLELWAEDIDDFCKDEQIAYIFEKIRRITPNIETEEDWEHTERLLNTLSAKSKKSKRIVLRVFQKSPRHLQSIRLWGSVISKLLK